MATQELIRSKNGSSELSVFANGEPASPAHTLSCVAKMRANYPDMSASFFNTLTEYIAKSGFTNERLQYAVDKLLLTHPYKTFTISDLLSIDARVKLYSYEEACTLVTSGKAQFSDFALFEYRGEMFRVSKADKLKYNIPDKL